MEFDATFWVAISFVIFFVGLVYLKVPHFNYIVKWRWIQEQKMKLTSKSKKTMSKSQIKKFIMCIKES